VLTAFLIGYPYRYPDRGSAPESPPLLGFRALPTGSVSISAHLSSARWNRLLSSAVNLPFAYALTAHKDPEEVLPPNMNCYSSIYANSRATCAPHLRRNRASNRPFTFSIEDFGSRVLQFAMHAADDRLNEALLDA
jgi:hypothetical protein